MGRFLLFIFSFLCSSILSQSQVNSATPLPQCQCIPDSTGTGCIQYDSRFQATTLDEAMNSFPDLTMERNASSPEPTLEAQAGCTSQQCIDCQNDLNYRLKKIGLIPLNVGEILPPTGNLSSSCKKYKFSGNEEGIYDKDDDRHERAIKLDSDSDESHEDENKKETNKSNQKKKNQKKDSQRGKRQVAGISPPAIGSTVTIVGQRYTLSCSAKGVATDSTGLVSLCSSCWVWRKLPDTYSPQYINELICDTTDAVCLSGYATCGIGHRSIDVVQTIGNMRTTVSISAGSFCECKVARTSALLSFVTGNGTASPQLPMGVPGVG